MRRTRWSVCGALGLQLASTAWAQLNPGPEFQVNTYTPSDQDDPDTCVFDDGTFVVVWESFVQEGDSNGVFAQRYAASGAPLAAEFQVNSYTAQSQGDPSVCCGPSSFVVAWTSYAQDGDRDGVFGQRFSAAGPPIGAEFQVNAYTTGGQSGPDLCCQDDGRFVVTWTDGYSYDGNSAGIFARAFASSGVPGGSDFQVNTYTPGTQFGPAICCDDAGGFVVVWTSRAQDGESDGIFAQAFSAPGVAAGAEFQVNTYTPNYQDYPDICCDGIAGFVVVWDSDVQDGDSEGIFGQVFSGPATAVGSEFLVNTYTTGFQGEPAVCCGPDGFAVVWEDNSSPSVTDPIHGRQFDSLGNPLGQAFVATEYPSSNAGDPRVACTPDGDLMVVWETDSGDTPPRDGSGVGVFARLLFEPLTILEIPTLGGWGLGLLAAALAAGGAVFLRRR